MTRSLDRAAAAGRGLERLGLDFIAYVPSNTIAPIINHFRQREPNTAPYAFPVTREEEAVGIIGAVSLAGKQGAIVMQDNGFGNALTALTTFAIAYHRPLLIVANTRGGLGEYNSMIHTISQPVPRMLEAAGILVFSLDRRNDPDDWEATVFEAGRHAQMTHRPVVVLMEFWDGAHGGGRA
jgi:sulfopyruvate decarboxylase subunit alpha